MMKKLALATLVLALGSVSAMAADFNGKWSADVPGRNGNTQTTTFTFTVDATAMTVTGTVTGRMGDMPITNGKVTADTITFDVVRTMNGNSFTISYAGKADGDTIKFTRTFGGGGMAGGGGGNGGSTSSSGVHGQARSSCMLRPRLRPSNSGGHHGNNFRRGTKERSDRVDSQRLEAASTLCSFPPACAFPGVWPGFASSRSLAYCSSRPRRSVRRLPKPGLSTPPRCAVPLTSA